MPDDAPQGDQNRAVGAIDRAAWALGEAGMRNPQQGLAGAAEALMAVLDWAPEDLPRLLRSCILEERMTAALITGALTLA